MLYVQYLLSFTPDSCTAHVDGNTRASPMQRTRRREQDAIFLGARMALISDVVCGGPYHAYGMASLWVCCESSCAAAYMYIRAAHAAGLLS